eukprot:TRINITY_DN6641_c0_g1_i2.p1 TRINITY_DN6641_c0_g1~~TRINITY_DN6641_c0_g1_i2.p1  ORF type:complete len:166 (-),score=66.32 TRINITY_DN6641_c0_g1_i2:152-649(-)
MLKTITFLALIFCLKEAAAFPQDEEDQSSGSSGGLGGFFKSAAKAVDEHKGAALSAIGLEEGKEGEALTTILKGLNIDSTIITNLTSSFTGQEGFSTLMDAFKNPEKLQTLLADKTGMDNETIQGFVETIKNKFKPSDSPGSAAVASPGYFVFGMLFAFMVIRGA